jgi:hypothetical protein
VGKWISNVQSAVCFDQFVGAEETKAYAKPQFDQLSSPCGDTDVSPFLPYEDGYRWPDLWSELDEMVEGLAIVFPLVEIRRKEKEINSDVRDTTQNTRLTMDDALDIVVANKSKIVESSLEKDFLMKSIEIAEKRKGILSASTLSIEDQMDQQELNYAVQLNHQRQRITIIFSGSRTMDFARHMEAYLKDIANPLEGHRGQENTVRIHNILYDLLIRAGKSENGKKRKNIAYFDDAFKNVFLLLNVHPRYKLYVSGHSLGASIATLFAFYAAAHPDTTIPKPVSLFTFGSPCVGDTSFRAAHQLLESLGKLRHIRVSNHQDVVTLSPTISMRLKFYDRSSHVGSLFKHVGMNLKLYSLYSGSPIELSYPKVRSGFFTNALDEVRRAFDQSPLLNGTWNPVELTNFASHDLKSYDERIWVNRPTLQTISLNNLYSRKEIVGNLIADF